MYKLCGKNFSFTVDEQGRCASFVNNLTGHEYVSKPGDMWKLIYAEDEREERPVFSEQQHFTAVLEKNMLRLCYDSLVTDEGTLDIAMELVFTLTDDSMEVTTKLQNNSKVQVAEFQLTALSGLKHLDSEEDDYLVWPWSSGWRIKNPAENICFSGSGRVYEGPDYKCIHQEALYPGTASMSWYDFCTKKEGIYVGSHDTLKESICLRVSRDVKENTLSLGVTRYPFCEPQEKWESAPIVYMPHLGDWHQGAKYYRTWLESQGWRAPDKPEWAKEFQGWLRLIMKTQYCEHNWDYNKIPDLFDEAQAAGINTLFLLGWEDGGFGRLYPDYKISERMGGKDKLQEGIDYVHSKGGKVIMFISYGLMDKSSDFYQKEGGDKCVVKQLWGDPETFCETYRGEGTYRKQGNGAMPLYYACPSTSLWNDQMLKLTKQCMDLGADGILYDLGGLKPVFCYDKEHPHKKPSHAFSTKSANYAKFRKFVKAYGEDKITLMEHNVDIFGQHMDIVHSVGCSLRDNDFAELYRYTFPEITMTNRDMGFDEKNYKEHISYSFIMGLAFDLSIFRCCGLPSQIPNYIQYMKKAIALRKEYADYLIDGRFVEKEGIFVDSSMIRYMCYQAVDGSKGVACWNTVDKEVTFTIFTEEGTARTVTIGAGDIAFYII